MIFTAAPLPGSYVVDLTPFTDSRGWFARMYCKNEFEQVGHTKEWVQVNHSFTGNAGTIRGMHYQLPPFRETKLVRCIAGSVYDVIVDLRKGSGTFLQWFGVELSAANKKMMYIPEGFAHGFQATADNSELIYHHTEFYVPGAEAGIRYNDPRVAIAWPLQVTGVSDRDVNHPLLEDAFTGF